ncbi:hypothetical protein JCM1840_005877 [Sporobolomyces johnsonii]
MHTIASLMPAAEPVEIDNLSSKLRALEVAIASEGAAAVDRQRSTDRQLTAILAALQPTSPKLSTATPVATPELAALSALITDLALKVGKLELSVAQSVEAAPALKSEASQIVAPSCASAEPTHDNKSIDSVAPQSEAKPEGYADMPAVVEAAGLIACESGNEPDDNAKIDLDEHACSPSLMATAVEQPHCVPAAGRAPAGIVDIFPRSTPTAPAAEAPAAAAGGIENPEEALIESNWDQVVDNWDDMNLRPELLHGIYAYGLERPRAIQQRAIVPVVAGHDVIAQAHFETGKTTALLISALQSIDVSLKQPQTLVLAPTRELAQQIQKVVVALSNYMNIECFAAVCGTSVREAMAKLQEGVHVVVGTPGRVFDMIQRRALKTDHIKIFCVDEADEMLWRGFKDQIYDVFQLLPPTIQVVLLSATMPADVLEVTTKFMRDPIRILVKLVALALEGNKQFYIAAEKEEWKLDILLDLYETITITQAVIFCNTRRKVDWLTEKLQAREFTVSAMHGDMDQGQREVIIKEFRSGSSRVLITTDLFARGFDVQQGSLVINYDLPSSRENYIRRIGRGGRFGCKGVAINFVATEDVPTLRDIERFYNTQIDEMPMNVDDLV